MNLDELSTRLDELQGGFLDNLVALMDKYNKPIYPVALVASPGQPVVHRAKTGEQILGHDF